MSQHPRSRGPANAWPAIEMISNLDRYKTDLKVLIDLGGSMDADLTLRYFKDQGTLKKEDEPAAEKLYGTFERDYQRWYSEAYAVIRQLMPDRLIEFEHLYKGDGKRREINATTYNVQDWLNGVGAGVNRYTGEKPYDDFAIVCMRFRTQLSILQTIGARFESSLFDIRQMVQADLFDCELNAARELLKQGFARGAGAIAGVVLEKHLDQVAANHNISVRKKHPAISDYNDLLKNNKVFDVPTWRQIQRFGTIRNLCDRNKGAEPTPQEVEELVSGVEKVTKSIF